MNDNEERLYEDEEERDEEERLTEAEVAESITALLFGESLGNTMLDHTSVRSFRDAGLMTSDEGLVLYTADGSEFQLTIKQRR